MNPSQVAQQASNKDMYIAFEPPPDYSGIAKAAAGKDFGGLEGGLFAAKVSTVKEMHDVLDEAVRCVIGGRGAVVEVVLDVDEKGRSR